MFTLLLSSCELQHLQSELAIRNGDDKDDDNGMSIIELCFQQKLEIRSQLCSQRLLHFIPLANPAGNFSSVEISVLHT